MNADRAYEAVYGDLERYVLNNMDETELRDLLLRICEVMYERTQKGESWIDVLVRRNITIRAIIVPRIDAAARKLIDSDDNDERESIAFEAREARSIARGRS